MKEQLKNKEIMLAPLAGVSDVGFRLIAESEKIFNSKKDNIVKEFFEKIVN